MILKKVMKDNEPVFIEITKEEAEEAKKQGETIIFLDKQVEVEETEQFQEEKPSSKSEKVDEDDEKETDFEKQVNKFTKQFTGSFGPHWHRNMHFSFKNEDDDPRTRKIMRILPFMDEADIHEIVEKLLSGDPSYANLKLPAIMPFLTQKDCDAVFKKKLESNELGHSIVAMAPFVSQDALSSLVDQYIIGAYPDLDIDSLYPFLDSKDIKRAFHYWLNKND